MTTSSPLAEVVTQPILNTLLSKRVADFVDKTEN